MWQSQRLPTRVLFHSCSPNSKGYVTAGQIPLQLIGNLDAPSADQTEGQIRKFKCKASRSTTSMKSHTKPSGESVCTGGNKNEAQPTGNTVFYLIPSLSLPGPSLPHAISSHFPLWWPTPPSFYWLSLQPLYLFSNYLLSLFLSCFLIFSTSFGVFGDLKMAHLAAFRR